MGHRLRVLCGCTDPSPSIEMWFTAGEDGRVRPDAVYYIQGEGMAGRSYFVDKNRPVRLPAPDDPELDRFAFEAAHVRWRIECERCDRPPIVAKASSLARLLTFYRGHGVSEVPASDLERRLNART